MEKLFKRADGYSEASGGNFAVVPLRRTGIEEERFFFEFKPSFNSQSIRVEWPIESAIAVIPSDIAITMVRLGSARNLHQEEVDQFNEAVDFENADGDKDGDKDQKDGEPQGEPVKPEDAKEPPADDPKDVADDKKEPPADDPKDGEGEGDDEDDGEPEEGTDKPKRGRKKKDAETKPVPLGIPGLTS